MGYLIIAEIDSIEDMIKKISDEKISQYLPVEYFDVEELLLKRPEDYCPFPLASIKTRERRMAGVKKVDSLDLIITKPLDDGFQFSKQNISEEFKKTITDFFGGVKMENRNKVWEYFGHVKYVLQRVTVDLNFLMIESSIEKYDLDYLKNKMKEKFGITEFTTKFF